MSNWNGDIYNEEFNAFTEDWATDAGIAELEAEDDLDARFESGQYDPEVATEYTEYQDTKTLYMSLCTANVPIEFTVGKTAKNVVPIDFGSLLMFDSVILSTTDGTIVNRIALTVPLSVQLDGPISITAGGIQMSLD